MQHYKMLKTERLGVLFNNRKKSKKLLLNLKIIATIYFVGGKSFQILLADSSN